MIEKLTTYPRPLPNNPMVVEDIGMDNKSLFDKINELVDAVNELQEVFESIHPSFNYKDKLNWIGRRCNFSNDCENWIEDIFVNIDRTDLEPEIPMYRALNGKLYKYCKLVTEPKTPAENVPEPIKLYVCADGSVYDNLDVAKSHAASIFNPLPAGTTTTDRVYLEQELIRTRKALDVALDWLGQVATPEKCDDDLCREFTKRKLVEIKTALEQKDKL